MSQVSPWLSIAMLGTVADSRYMNKYRMMSITTKSKWFHSMESAQFLRKGSNCGAPGTLVCCQCHVNSGSCAAPGFLLGRRSDSPEQKCRVHHPCALSESVHALNRGCPVVTDPWRDSNAENTLRPALEPVSSFDSRKGPRPFL